MAVITFCNRKGGTGKTTTSVHVAGGIARRGMKALLVDIDPQAHATLWLARERAGQGGGSIVDFLRINEAESQRLDKVIVETSIEGLWLLPSDKGAAEMEVTYGKRSGAAHMLKNALSSEQDRFHYIIIDTPPYIGLLMTMGLLTADYAYITMPLQFLAIDGLKDMMLLVKKISQKANSGLSIGGIIPVMFNARLMSVNRHLNRLKEEFGQDFILPYIRQNVRLSEAAEAGRLVFDFAPQSHGARDYERLIDRIIKDTSE